MEYMMDFSPFAQVIKPAANTDTTSTNSATQPTASDPTATS